MFFFNQNVTINYSLNNKINCVPIRQIHLQDMYFNQNVAFTMLYTF